MTRRRAYLLLAALAVVWGVHWPITTIGLRELPPFTYAALRVAAALPVVLAILASLAPRRALRLPPRHDLPVLLVVGLGQMAAAMVLMNLALQAVAPGRSSVLGYTTPFWAALIQAAVLGMALGRGELAGIGIGLAGIAILLNPAAIDWRSGGQLAGSFGLLLSAATTAVSVIVVRRHRWQATPLELQPWQLLVALIPLTTLALVLDAGRPIHVDAVAVLCVLYSGPLATAFAYWASQSVSRALSPTTTTMGMLATPVVGLVASAVLVGERVGALDLIGFGVTIAGIAVVSIADVVRSRAQPETVSA